MKLTPNFYRDRVCLNVLAGSKANASAIYEAAEGHVLVGVLSKNYPDVASAVADMREYAALIDNALSVGLGACLNAALLYWQLRKQKIFTPQPGWFLFLLRLMIAVIIMSAALLGVMYLMPEWSQGTMPFRLLRLMVVVVAGVVAYFATLLLLGFRVKEFARRTA